MVVRHRSDGRGDEPEHVALEDPGFLRVVSEMTVAARTQKRKVIDELLGPRGGGEDKDEK